MRERGSRASRDRACPPGGRKAKYEGSAKGLDIFSCDLRGVSIKEDANLKAALKK